MNISIFIFILLICIYIIKIYTFDNRKIRSYNNKFPSEKVAISPSKYFEFKSEQVSCLNIFRRMKNRKPATEWPPPKIPPPHLYNNFTQNGEMPIIKILYTAQRYSGSEARLNKWNTSYINAMINRHKLHKQIGWYNLYEEDLIDEAITKYSVKNKDVAVIGSEIPWVEAIIASKKPSSITTIEYGKIISSIPYIKTFTPSEFAENTLKNRIQFDFVISFSSMEHSGLGRYGDELDPDGDIHAAEEVWCMLKKGGYFLIGIPFAKNSYIRWNADRNYGPERMKYFAKNFQQIEFFGKPWLKQHPLLLRKRVETEY